MVGHQFDVYRYIVDLPDMSGFEVLLNLVPRAQYPEIPVIVLTRLSNHYLLEAATKNGALAALHNPLYSGDLLDQVIHRRWSLRAENWNGPMSHRRQNLK